MDTTLRPKTPTPRQGDALSERSRQGGGVQANISGETSDMEIISAIFAGSGISVDPGKLSAIWLGDGDTVDPIFTLTIPKNNFKIIII